MSEPGGRQRLRRFVGRTGRRTRVELLRIAVLAALAELAVRVLPLPRAARLFGVDLDLRPRTDAAVGTDELPGWAARRIALVDLVMDAWPGDGLCLRRSLVTAQRVRRLQPELHLGVARSSGTIGAHAWVEVAGHALSPGEYARLSDPRQPAR